MGKFKADTKKGKAQIFRAAAKAIEQHGWLRGRFGDVGRGFCAIGAVKHVNGGKMPDGAGAFTSRFSVLSEDTAKKVLGEETASKLRLFNREYGSVVSIFVFNDVHAKSAEEVTSFLRKLARHLEHGGDL